MQSKNIKETNRKVLSINLDQSIYGSFAEIGGGQEVARNFFHTGGASGTVAKTHSAYDMVFSDTLYGKCPTKRYVSQERLNQIMDFEYNNLISVLCDKRHENTKYFSFCNTVETLNYKKNNESHGWIGVRFQLNPKSEPNNVIIHTRLLENDRQMQQNTLGIIGVNLIYACYFYHNNPDQFLKSLLDNLSNDRVEIDMINMTGPQLDYIDNRLLSLKLIKYKMTNASMFDRNGIVRQPTDMFYKKNLILIRGSFRPITYVGFDMLKTGYSLFKKESGENFNKEKNVVLCEMTLNNLIKDDDFGEKDFLDRVDILCGMGQNVLVSDFSEFYKLCVWLRRFKLDKIRLIIGAITVKDIINKKYYSNLRGGILEAMGLMFLDNLKAYVYPAKNSDNNEILNIKNMPVEKEVEHLYDYLTDNDFLEDITNYNEKYLSYFSDIVLEKIQLNDPEWEKMVPKYVSNFIKNKKLFGFEG